MITEPGWRQNPNLVECFDNCVAMFHFQAAQNRPTDGCPVPQAPPPNTDSSTESNR